jgi:hypothetical protein
MISKNNLKIKLLMLFIFISSALIAQNLKYFENKDMGVRFNYPEHWIKDERSTEVVLSSHKDFIETDEGGAGFGLAVIKVDGARINTFTEFCSRYADIETDEYGSPEIKELAGHKWQWVGYQHEDDNYSGDIYFTKLNGRYYFLLTGFHPPEKQDVYEKEIEIILHSFELFKPQGDN